MRNNPMHPRKNPTPNTAWQDVSRPMKVTQDNYSGLLHDAREVLEDGVFLAKQGLSTAKKLAVNAAKVASTVAGEELEHLGSEITKRAKKAKKVEL